MILPKKHISMSASLIGLSGIVLKIISEEILSLDECWDILYKDYISTGIIQKKHKFDNFILSIDLLYIMGAIILDDEGRIQKT